MNKNRMAIFAVLAAGFLVGAGAFFLNIREQRNLEADRQSLEQTVETDPFDNETQSQTIGRVVEYKGLCYRYNSRITNILVMGIDQDEEFKKTYKPGEAGQADFLLLLSTDQDSGITKLFEIHRNTMTSVDHYDSSGSYTNSVTEQITLQYAYGIGGDQSAWATKKTVSELLYNLDIDGYLTINAFGIERITDAIGGVEVSITEDNTDLDDRFQAGSRIHMDGETTRKFIQHRDINIFDSASGRMRRQTDFILALIEKLSGTNASDLIDLLEPYLNTCILTDLSGNELKTLLNSSYDTEHILTLPGESRMGEEYEEYKVAEEELQQLILSNYYKECESDEE